MHGQEVFIDVSAEVSRVIRIDGDAKTSAEKLPKVVVLDGIENAQFHVGERADRQRHTFRSQTIDERRIFNAANTVINPRGAKSIQSLPYIVRRPFLTGVRHNEQSFLTSPCEDRREFFGRMISFRRIKPHAREAIAERQRILESLHRVVAAEVAEERQNQL